MRYRVLGVIQCRAGSRRLPGKALMQVKGRTLLKAVIERVMLAKRVDRLVLATTCKIEDDSVCEVGASMGLPVVRGPCDDVLGRFIGVLDVYPSGSVVRITADNPLTDPFMLDRLIEHFMREDLDFCRIADPPYGAGTDIFKVDRLREVAGKTDNPRHREHIITYFLDYPAAFKTRPLALIPEETRPDVRITVDTEKDLKRIREVMDGLKDFPFSSMADIIALSDRLYNCSNQ